jgi:hypothetical protein
LRYSFSKYESVRGTLDEKNSVIIDRDLAVAEMRRMDERKAARVSAEPPAYLDG